MTAPASSAPWRVDHDWLWRRAPRNAGAPACLRLDVTGPGAAAAARAWVESVPADVSGVRGGGGWRVDSAAPPFAVAPGTSEAETAPLCDAGPDAARLFLTSAGEDVADGLDWAAQEAHEAITGRGAFAFVWTPLPRPKR